MPKQIAAATRANAASVRNAPLSPPVCVRRNPTTFGPTKPATLPIAFTSAIPTAAEPVVALNRAIAVGQAEGPARGLAELHAITDSERLASYPFYFAAQGELELRLGKGAAASEHFRSAIALARNATERRHLEKRLRRCSE